jgi:hypothetical protein
MMLILRTLQEMSQEFRTIRAELQQLNRHFQQADHTQQERSSSHTPEFPRTVTHTGNARQKPQRVKAVP